MDCRIAVEVQKSDVGVRVDHFYGFRGTASTD
jgi:hypothetical protein